MIYRFRTSYTLEYEPERIWAELTDVESWPRYWKYFRKVSIGKGENSVSQGTVINCTVKALALYTIRFSALVVRYEENRCLEIESSGDLEGRGIWNLHMSGNSTESEFIWHVEPRKGFIRFVEKVPGGRQFLEFNHRVMMEDGYRSFIRKLG